MGFYGCISAGTYGSRGAAVAAAANCANPASLVLSTEWSGNTYETSDGQYSFTLPEEGDTASSPFDPTAVPADTTYAGAYHTHGGNDPDYMNEIFSPTDISLYSTYSTLHRVNTPGFVITPSGRIEGFYPANSAANPYGCVMVGSAVPAGLYPGSPAVPTCH